MELTVDDGSSGWRAGGGERRERLSWEKGKDGEEQKEERKKRDQRREIGRVGEAKEQKAHSFLWDIFQRDPE